MPLLIGRLARRHSLAAFADLLFAGAAQVFSVSSFSVRDASNIFTTCLSEKELWFNVLHSAIAENLLPGLMADDEHGRFWHHRGDDTVQREKQMLSGFLYHNGSVRPTLYEYDMKTPHVEMPISESDRASSKRDVRIKLGGFNLPENETSDLMSLIDNTKCRIVQA